MAQGYRSGVPTGGTDRGGTDPGTADGDRTDPGTAPGRTLAMTAGVDDLLDAQDRPRPGPVPLELVVVTLGRREHVDDHRPEVEQHPVRCGRPLTPDRADALLAQPGSRIPSAIASSWRSDPPEQMTNASATVVSPTRSSRTMSAAFLSSASSTMRRARSRGSRSAGGRGGGAVRKTVARRGRCGVGRAAGPRVDVLGAGRADPQAGTSMGGDVAVDRVRNEVADRSPGRRRRRITLPETGRSGPARNDESVLPARKRPARHRRPGSRAPPAARPQPTSRARGPARRQPGTPRAPPTTG